MRSALSILASLLAAATATTAVALARAPALPGRASAGVWGPDPAVFADNMVLASSDVWHAGSTPARVWGVVNAGESVAVLGLPAGAVVAPSNPFSSDAMTGGFAITIAVPSSLTAYNISFNGSATSKTLHNVLFGYTLLCSGQSTLFRRRSKNFFAPSSSRRA